MVLDGVVVVVVVLPEWLVMSREGVWERIG
jgi:hypothetical protein